MRSAQRDIILKSSREIELMRRAGRVVFGVLARVRELASTDPMVESSLMPVGQNLIYAAMPTLAVAVFEEVIKRSPHLIRAWNNLGVALTARAWRRYDDGDKEFDEDFGRARKSFKKALEIDPTDKFAKKKLRELSKGPGEGVD